MTVLRIETNLNTSSYAGTAFVRECGLLKRSDKSQLGAYYDYGFTWKALNIETQAPVVKVSVDHSVVFVDEIVVESGCCRFTPDRSA